MCNSLIEHGYIGISFAILQLFFPKTLLKCLKNNRQKISFKKRNRVLIRITKYRKPLPSTSLKLMFPAKVNKVIQMISNDLITFLK